MIDVSAKISPLAVIAEGAVIGPDCDIGPFCVIDKNVELGAGVKCFSHVAISGRTRIGDGTKIWPFASIGHQPQDLKYKGEDTELIIGKNNMIRESTSINLGTVQGGGITRIGDDNLFMIGSHVGHDCHIGNNIVFANNAAIAGHVTIEDGAIIGGQVGVIQFSRIGKGAMIGAGSMVAADVVPYGLTMAARPYLAGLNYVGLKRRGIDNTGLRDLKAAFDALFMGEKPLKEAAQELHDNAENNPYLQDILDFILADSERSFQTPERK